MKISKKVLLIILSGGLLAGGIIAWLMYGGAGPIHMVLDNGVKAKFTATLKNTEVSRDKDGKKIWDFKIDELNNDQTTEKLYLHGIRGKVYRDDGSFYDVVAKQGEMRNGSQDFVIYDGVSAVLSTDGSKLVADRIEWMDKKQLITATGNVEVWKDDWHVRGDRIVTTSAFKKIHLTGNGLIERLEKK